MENEIKRGRKKKEIDGNFAKLLSELLQKVKTKNGIVQDDVAKAIGVSRQALGKWANGETVPDILDLKKLAKYFNVSSDYLIGLSDNKTTKAELRMVCDYTGLSKENIEVIKFLKEAGYKHIIESVINDKFFIELISGCGGIEVFCKNLQEILNSDEYKKFQSENKLLENELSRKMDTDNDAEIMIKMAENMYKSGYLKCNGLEERIDLERYKIIKHTERLMNIFDYRVNEEEKGNGEYYSSEK